MTGWTLVARSCMAAAAVVTLLVGCGSTGGPGRSAAPEPPRCAFPYPPPSGYVAHGHLEVPTATHIGVRDVYGGFDERSIILTSGIPGEFGEGLPVVGELPLASGVTGSLMGEERTWLLIWGEVAPCTPLTVTGNGFTRSSFRELVVGMGLLAPSRD